MKKLFLCLCIFVLFIGYHVSYAQEVAVSNSLHKDIENKTLLPLFEALRNGSVSTIKLYLSGSMYKKNKVLLEQNKGYSKFLRNFYQGAKFRLNKVVKADDDIIVDILIEFPNGDLGINKLRLMKEKGPLWKVVEELSRESYGSSGNRE